MKVIPFEMIVPQNIKFDVFDIYDRDYLAEVGFSLLDDETNVVFLSIDNIPHLKAKAHISSLLIDKKRCKNITFVVWEYITEKLNYGQMFITPANEDITDYVYHLLEYEIVWNNYIKWREKKK